MPSVYVSSTYQDLTEVRLRVIQAIRKVPKHVPVSMEHYTADDRRPLQKCLDDVRRSDIYIGILGARSGFVPEGETLSITRLEYEAAYAKRIPCLCFLMELVAPLDDSADAAAIREFRAVVQERHTCQLVTKDTPIGEQVMASLIERAFGDIHVQRGGAALEEQQLLPFACDRRPQQQDLRIVLRGTETERPTTDAIPVCVVHGNRSQAPDKFAEWLAAGLLREILLGEEVTQLAFEWPLKTKSPVHFEQVLLGSLWEASLPLTPSDFGREALARTLGARPDRFVFSTDLSLDAWHSEERERLETLCDFFDHWPATGNPPLGVLLWVTYKEPVPRRWWSWSRRDPALEINQSVRDALLELGQGRSRVKLIAELDGVPEGEALKWARRPDVRSLAGPHADAEEGVRAIYRESKSETIEMRILAKELKEMLKRFQQRPTR